MELLVKCKLGGTKRFLRYAEKQRNLPLLEQGHELAHHSTVIIEGPYGRMRPLRQFDSVFFIAGSSGGTFIIPLLRDIVDAWKTADVTTGSRWSWSGYSGAATRYLRFVWVVKSRAQYGWFADQLLTVAEDVEQLRGQGHDYELDMSIYVTCDEEFVAGGKDNSGLPGCNTTRGLADEIPSSAPSIQYDEKINMRPTSIDPEDSGIDGAKNAKQSCGPNGTCCCQATIEDEDAISSTDEQYQCCCGKPEPMTTNDEFSTSAESISSDKNSRESPTQTTPITRSIVHPSVNILSGRPQPKTLIRKMLEQALGESAVVVCGPQGLVSNVRQSVVSLSDERAIHKGTGAQGVYLHAEAFEY